VDSQPKGIMTLGHVLVDGIGSASKAFLDRYGHLPSPIHIDPEGMEELRAFLAGEGKGSGADVSWSLGGGAAVAARTAGALGFHAEVWASVGRDEGGRFLAEELAAAGVEARFFLSGKPTGLFCSLGTQEGKRKLIVSPGAARDVRLVRIPSGALRPGWVFHIDGLLIDEILWLSSLAERAKAAGMVLSMDISTEGNAKTHGRALRDFAEKYCDLVFANEKEFEAMGGSPDPDADSGTAWVVKRGGRGAALLRGGRWIEAAAFHREPVDDTGAGDVFSAGFLCARLEGRTVPECLRFGNAVAAASIGYVGSTVPPGVLKRAFEDGSFASGNYNSI